MSAAVSVVIPAYNRAAMLREAVASVLAQRGVRFELIVVDDGSSDATAAEMERLVSATIANQTGGAIRFVRHERNRGVAAARNCGALLATAPFLAFLDSDDWWMPDKLARQLRFFANHPRYALAQTGELWLRDGVRMNPGRRHRKRTGDFFVESLRTCLVSPSAVMMRTTLFNEIGGFDEDLRAAEDYDLWLRVMVDEEIGLLDEPLVVRRAGHPGQLSASLAALDRFRIVALLKLLMDERLPEPRRAAVITVLIEKCQIYATGLRKRGQLELAALIDGIAEDAAGWNERPDARLAEAIELTRGFARQTGLFRMHSADSPVRCAQQPHSATVRRAEMTGELAASSK
jgi:glycosyltransferase involved in cell wall biosynthesis